ncbi:hypothetical protein QVD17_18591 [Tagetes erecta]|uniref:Uncharacterized protein n=1 Tax=Tagetes erecta TaxID=13708 RepID=A0AAD8KKT3_TARER|nr:hypothetical protein QVD17_18591 [Tagetes erecta]
MVRVARYEERDLIIKKIDIIDDDDDDGRRKLGGGKVTASSNSFIFIDTNSFSKDGRKINVGDCALFKPPYNSLPFVGRIRKLKLGKENNLSLCVNWLYRPADVKLKDGASLEAAPNEVFYSFHKDEIPAASLLHPCKVTFLRKGVEFPPGISSFVCRRVYDIESECLWWLTDKNYINSFLTQELQEEVDQLLDKSVIEMHGAVQTGGRSPKPINGPNGSAQLKPSSDTVQNSSSSISSHAKSKKREHGAHNSESVKRDRLSKVDDADSGQRRPEHILKTEIAKIADKGGLVDFSGVEKLIQLMRPDGTEKKLDLACRAMLVDVISGTDRFDCLARFVHLRGLLVLDEWLQEIHKCKIGDGSPKENDKSVEEFLFSLLRALDKLPVNLHALQTCNVGKSVNHLRSHKNSEIQKKARSLVSTWKRRVEAEMNIIETKSSTSRGGGSWPNKSMISEVSHVGGSRRISGSSEVGPKGSTSQLSAMKAQQPKQSSGETAIKSPTSPGSTKLSPSSATKEGRSCSSSQSPNNSQSCSSDHGKTGASSVSKISGSVSHSKNSSNGFHGSTIPGVQNEAGKVSHLSRAAASEKGSPTKHISEKVSDVSHVDNGSGPRLIVRLPNTGRSPAQTASVESPEDSSTISGKGPLLVPSEKQVQKLSGKNDSINTVANTNTGSRGKEELVVRDEEHGKKDASFGSGSSSGVTPKPGKLYEPSYSSINALVESCAKFSEASVSPSVGDDGGINLLASVAAGEITRSDVSPACSPGSNSPIPEDSSFVNVAKLRQMADDGGQSEDISMVNGHAMAEQIDSVGEDSNTQLVNMTPDVKPTGLIEDASVEATNMKPNSLSPVQEDKCLDDKSVKTTASPPDAVVPSVKPETQINDESASWSSSDMHEDEKKLAHKRLTDQPVTTTSCGDVDLGPKSGETDDKKAEQSARQNPDSGTSECTHENVEKDGKTPVAVMQEVRSCEKPNDVTELNCPEDRTVKLDFDLNEVIPSDDGIQGEVEKTAFHTSSPLPSSIKTRPGLITVAAAAKGPFIPSESLSRGKPELGWKGSAATSAFRPAEPRKVDVPVSDNHNSKPVRPLFDFDLNVGVEDAGQHNAPSGLDLDLNACEEGPEVVQLSVSRPSRSFLPGGPNSSRDFDLNGPGVEEVGGESVSFPKNSMQFMSGVPNVRMNNIDVGNISTWFPPNNTYPAITIPSQRMLTPVTASTPLNPEMFRGPVLSSSPAVAFPSTVPFQHPSFPFETSFSLPSISNTYSSVSNAYADSSSSGGGPIYFPSIPSVGPNGMMSVPYRPYIMGLPGGSSNVGPDGRKWGSQVTSCQFSSPS